MPLPLHQEVCRALHASLSSGADGDLPMLLISVLSTLSSRGGTVDTSQIHEPRVRSAIDSFLAALLPLGVSCCGTDSHKREWRWDQRGPSDDGRALLRVISDLMDGAGATAKEALAFEQKVLKKSNKTEDAKPLSSRGGGIPYLSALADLLSLGVNTPTLSNEVSSLLGLVLEDGELAIIDGIADDDVKNKLHTLFRSVGCVEVDVSDEEDGDGDGNGDEIREATCRGYGLPEEDDEKKAEISRRIRLLIRACEEGCAATTPTPLRRPIKGPAMPAHGILADSDGDDEGPMVLGAKGSAPALSTDQINAMAARTALELAVAKGEAPRSALEPAPTGAPAAAVREEWMTTPGEHTFLDAVQGTTTSRTFKNERHQDKECAPDVTPAVSKETRAELARIMEEHAAARGPSLIDTHRQKKTDERRAKEEERTKGGKGGGFNWNRDRDLDSGRRVDKAYLAMVLGGAKEGLKDKFQGTITKGFM